MPSHPAQHGCGKALQEPVTLGEIHDHQKPKILWNIYKQALLTAWPSMSTVLKGSMHYVHDASAEFCAKRFHAMSVASGGIVHAWVFGKSNDPASI